MLLKLATNNLQWFSGLFRVALAGIALFGAIFPIAVRAEESGKMLVATKDPNTSEVVLGNDIVRVRFPWKSARFEKFPNGYTGYTLEMYKDGQWAPMAVAPYFSSFSYRSGWGRDWLHYVIPRTVEVSQDAGYARVVFKETMADLDRVPWRFEFTFEVRPGAPYIETTYTATVDGKCEVLLFDGPRLHVGEGAFGGAREEALFPGIEYLQHEERSSDMDAMGPGARLHMTPLPSQITIPLMAIYNEGCVAGLMWDPMKPWHGDKTCPSALFASPNWLENESNHLLGLFLPSAPDYVPENGVRAHIPLVLEAGETMRMEASLFAAPASSVMDAVELWLKKRGGLPEPTKPPCSYREHVAKQVQILVDDAWDKEGKGWPWEYGGDATFHPTIATVLAKSLPFIDDKELEKRARERIQVVAKDTAYLPLAFRWGNLARAVEVQRASAQALIDAQAEDGSWGYHQSETAELGLLGLMGPPEPGYIAEEGQRSQGITAGKTASLLEYALLANDPAALAAGLRGIEDMNRYTVPYVYDNDECPPSPSLHGSYFGMRACLIAYRMTQDKAYLDQARKWAMTGLPFVYLWSFGPRNVDFGQVHTAEKHFVRGNELYENTERDPMLYGALYGYGSSQYMHHWYGLLVQWIGLKYAEDLVRMAKYDSSFPWETLSEGLVSSGMWQTFDVKPFAGYFPDAFSVERWAPSGPAFSPAWLLNTILLCGFDVQDWDTTIVPHENGRFHITSSTSVGGAVFTDGMLRFTLDDPACAYVRAVVTDVPSNSSITVDGQALQQVEDLISVEEGWQRTPQGITLIKVCQKEKPRAIEIAS